MLPASAVPQDFAPQLYNGQCEAGTGSRARRAPGCLTFESRGILHDTAKSPVLGHSMIFNIFVYIGLLAAGGVPRISPRKMISQTMAFLGTFLQPGWSTFRCGAAATGPLLLRRPIESGQLLAVTGQDLDGWVASSARFMSMSIWSI